MLYDIGTVVVITPDPHDSHETRYAVVLTKYHHPDVELRRGSPDPRKDQPQVVVCLSTQSNYPYQTPPIPTNGYKGGPSRDTSHVMPWSIHTAHVKGSAGTQNSSFYSQFRIKDDVKKLNDKGKETVKEAVKNFTDSQL